MKDSVFESHTSTGGEPERSPVAAEDLDMVYHGLDCVEALFAAVAVVPSGGGGSNETLELGQSARRKEGTVSPSCGGV